MTTDDRARLRSLAEAATPGPWSAVPYTRSDSVWRITEASPPNMGIARVYDRSWSRDAVGFGDENAAYIAALDPQTVLNLLDAAALGDALREAALHVVQSVPSAPNGYVAVAELADALGVDRWGNKP